MKSDHYRGKLCNHTKYGGYQVDSSLIRLGVQEKPHKCIIQIVADSFSVRRNVQESHKYAVIWCNRRDALPAPPLTIRPHCGRSTNHINQSHRRHCHRWYHYPREALFKSYWECTSLFPRCARWMDDHNMICSQAT